MAWNLHKYNSDLKSRPRQCRMNASVIFELIWLSVQNTVAREI